MVFDDEIWEDYLPQNTKYKIVVAKNIHGRTFDNFKTIKYNGEDVLLIYPSTGAPAAVCEMELLIASGVEKIVAFGTCGRLSGEIAQNTIILPTSAYREEGTSYHYLPEGDEIKQSKDSVVVMQAAFVDRDLQTLQGKVWTTDAVYRETADKVDFMRGKGCLAVDMEMSALVAVAGFRQIGFAGFLIADDILGPETRPPLPRDNAAIFQAAMGVVDRI